MLIIGVPVILLTRDHPVASYFTQTALVFLVCVSMLLLIFLPKMKVMRKAMSSTISQGSDNRRDNISIKTETYLRKELEYLSQIRELKKLLGEDSTDSKACEECKERDELPIVEDACTSAFMEASPLDNLSTVKGTFDFEATTSALSSSGRLDLAV